MYFQRYPVIRNIRNQLQQLMDPIVELLYNFLLLLLAQKFLEHQATLKARLNSHYNALDRKISGLQLDQKRKLDEVKEQRQTATQQARQLGLRELQRAEQRVMQKRAVQATQEAKKAHRVAEAEKLRRKVTEHVAPDPQRLLQATKGWEHRLMATTGSGDAEGMVGVRGRRVEEVLQKWQVPANVFDLSKLGTPSWRKV